MKGLSDPPLDTLWKTDIVPRLGLPPEVEFQKAPGGVSSRTVRVSSRDSDWMLRLHPLSDRRKHHKHLRNGKTLRSLGFRNPHPIGWGCAAGWCWLVEEYVPGVPGVEAVECPEGVAAIRETLVRLHSHRRRWAGEPRRWGSWNLPREWVRSYPRSWSRLVERFPELHSVQQSVMDWVESLPQQLRPNRYELQHGDFHPGNLILTPGGEVCLLDYSTPRYGVGYLEALWFAHNAFGEEDERAAQFLDRYVAEIPLSGRTDPEEGRKVLHAWFHLRQADRNADLALGRGGRGTTEQREKWGRAAWEMWLRFCELSRVDSPPGTVEPESPFPYRPE